PVGLDGDTNTSALVFSVLAASSCSTLILYAVSAPANTSTGMPPASLMDSGYVVQYGVGSRTSSSGSVSAAKVLYTACLPPLVTITWEGSTATPESRKVLSAIA